MELIINNKIRDKLGRFAKQYFGSKVPGREEELYNIIYGAVDEVTEHVPPLTAGNMPPAPYWERGRGIIRADGTVGRQSERASEGFYVDIRGKEAVVSNIASYAALVYGPFQTATHRGTGWKNIEVILNKAFNVESSQEFEEYIESIREIFD